MSVSLRIADFNNDPASKRQGRKREAHSASLQAPGILPACRIVTAIGFRANIVIYGEAAPTAVRICR